MTADRRPRWLYRLPWRARVAAVGLLIPAISIPIGLLLQYVVFPGLGLGDRSAWWSLPVGSFIAYVFVVWWAARQRARERDEDQA